MHRRVNPWLPPRSIWLGIAWILGIALVAVLAPSYNAHAAIIATPAQTVHTCKPRAIVYDQAYRVDDDIFAGSPGKSCLTVKGSAFTIDSNITPRPDGTVAAYLKTYVGVNYTSRDPLAGLPVKVGRTQAYTLHVKTTGHASSGSNYISDGDWWLSNTKAGASQHGTAEIVVALNWDHAFPAGKRVSISHHWYELYRWMTGPAGAQWPIYLIRSVTQTRSRTLRPAVFLYHLRKLGWVHRTLWLDSAAWGAECWHRCAGLGESMTVTK